MKYIFILIKFLSNLIAHIGLLLLSPFIGQKQIASFIAKRLISDFGNKKFQSIITVALIITIWSPILYIGFKYPIHPAFRQMNVFDKTLLLGSGVLFILATIVGLTKMLIDYGTWFKNNILKKSAE